MNLMYIFDYNNNNDSRTLDYHVNSNQYFGLSCIFKPILWIVM